MGLFKKRDKKKELKELPELPRLPKLPKLPDDFEFEKTLPQLPGYSTTALNNRFSQNTIRDEQKTDNFLTDSSENQIKEAISGEKGGMFEANEFVRKQMMPEQEIKPSDFARLNPEGKFEKSERGREPKIKKSGQIFIKIDKFEESLKIFELTKNKIIEMERMLEDIKKLKEKEERELSYWMAEIQTIKNQTEKVERDIFSKLE